MLEYSKVTQRNASFICKGLMQTIKPLFRFAIYNQMSSSPASTHPTNGCIILSDFLSALVSIHYWLLKSLKYYVY